MLKFALRPEPIGLSLSFVLACCLQLPPKLPSNVGVTEVDPNRKGFGVHVKFFLGSEIR